MNLSNSFDLNLSNLTLYFFTYCFSECKLELLRGGNCIKTLLTC